MHIFMTGATGFIGTPLVKELIEAGYQVTGLARSEASAQALTRAGAQVQHGSLEDLDSLREGAKNADGVIHLGFIHDFSDFQKNCQIDKDAIEAIGSVLQGSDRPLIITSGVAVGSPGPGQIATEDHFNPQFPRLTEIAGNALLKRGVNVSVVRLPQVHDTRKQGLITYVIDITRQKRLSAYIGEGQNRWSAGHVSDVSHLYRLALEKNESGARYHAVAEEGITMREIAEVIGKGLDVPVQSISEDEAPAHFGWMSMFANFDMSASSAQTREKLNWHPTGPGLIADLKQMEYGLSAI